jgi:hypothetical protein
MVGLDETMCVLLSNIFFLNLLISHNNTHFQFTSQSQEDTDRMEAKTQSHYYTSISSGSLKNMKIAFPTIKPIYGVLRIQLGITTTQNIMVVLWLTKLARRVHGTMRIHLGITILIIRSVDLLRVKDSSSPSQVRGAF